MATDYTQRLDEETQKANAMRAAHQRVLSGEQRVADQGALNAARAANQPQSIGLNNMTAVQRNTAADTYRNHVDSATGSGPGAAAAASGIGLDFGTMQKRANAYAADPSLLAARNAREDLLGSGIRMGVDGKGQLTLSNEGGASVAAQGVIPRPGAQAPASAENPMLLNMPPPGSQATASAAGSMLDIPRPGTPIIQGNQQDPLASYSRANAARQSMIDSQRGGVHILGGGGGMDADRQALLRKTMTAHPGAQNGQLTAAQLNAARGIMSDAQGEAMKRAEMSQRAASDQARLGIDQQRLGIDQQRLGFDQDASVRRHALDQQRMGIDVARFGMDKSAHDARMEDSGFIRQARQGLIDTANSKDAAAQNEARMQAIAAGIIKPPSNEYSAVTDSMGLNVTRTNKATGAIDIINPKTGAVNSIPAPGAPAASTAPNAALDFLKKNPQHAAAFKAKYGYLPEGY